MWIEKNGKTWRVRELVHGEKVTLAAGYATKTAAKTAMVQMKADALTGGALVPRGGERTVAALCAAWWSDVGPTYTRVKSRESVHGVMDRYVVRLLGEHTLRELEDNPRIVQQWVNDLSAGRTRPSVREPRPLAPKTVRNAHGLLSQLMAYAIRQRLLRGNPCADTRLPDQVFTEHMYLTPAEADRLIAALPEHWRPLVLFMLATGCRWSEALGVRAKALDILSHRVTFTKKWIEDAAGHFHEEDVKSRRGRRTARFTQRVAESLAPLMVEGTDRDRHIFLTPTGTDRVRHKDFYDDVWHPARAAAGLDGLRVHDLRHTHVAWLIAGGVGLSAISRRLGHKSIAITDDVYGHLTEEVNEALVGALDGAMSVIDFRGTLGETDPREPPSTPVKPRRTPAQRRSQLVYRR